MVESRPNSRLRYLPLALGNSQPGRLARRELPPTKRRANGTYRRTSHQVYLAQPEGPFVPLIFSPRFPTGLSWTVVRRLSCKSCRPSGTSPTVGQACYWRLFCSQSVIRSVRGKPDGSVHSDLCRDFALYDWRSKSQTSAIGLRANGSHSNRRHRSKLEIGAMKTSGPSPSGPNPAGPTNDRLEFR